MNEARELLKIARVLTAKKKEKRIVILRRILKEHQYEKIDGKIVDATTASMLVQVFDALKPSSQRKFDDIPLMKLVNFGWSLTK